MRHIYWEDYLTERLEADELPREDAIDRTLEAFPYLERDEVEDEIDMREEVYAEMRTADRYTRRAEGGFGE